MMKRSHAIIGAATGVAVAKSIGGPMVAGGVVACIAAVLPDLDHPSSAVGQLLPRWWHRLTPGHRGPTHSLVWCFALALLGHAGQSLVMDGQPAPLLGLALFAGALSHVIADGLTLTGEAQAKTPRLVLSLGAQRHVGAAGVPPFARPRRLAVPHQPQSHPTSLHGPSPARYRTARVVACPNGTRPPRPATSPLRSTRPRPRPARPPRRERRQNRDERYLSCIRAAGGRLPRRTGRLGGGTCAHRGEAGAVRLELGAAARRLAGGGAAGVRAPGLLRPRQRRAARAGGVGRALAAGRHGR